jgi:hypothetical protein
MARQLLGQEEVYRSGFLWGYLNVWFEENTNEATAEIDRSVVDGFPMPEWVIECYWGRDKPDDVDQYEWDCVKFWPPECDRSFPQ